MLFKNDGYCDICECNTTFLAVKEWLRDHYICERCNSIPRQRALIHIMNQSFPAWREMIVHESSPDGVSSNYIKKNCCNYSASFYFQNIELGTYTENNKRCENLSKMTFPDNSFDLLVTQDVLEHVIEPEMAFAEIARVLKAGGAHIFTVPWYPNKKTNKRAELRNGEIRYLCEAVYHGDPINDNGALVVNDWGDDLIDRIYINSGLTTTAFLIKDRNLGLDGEFLYVFVSRKQD